MMPRFASFRVLSLRRIERTAQLFVLTVALALSSLAAGCGYTLRSSRNSELTQMGIHRVFVAPVVNDTYQAGVEILVYNEAIRTFAAEGMVAIADAPEAADAILRIRVRTANPSVLATTSAKYLFPSGAGVGIEGPKNRVVATVYNATLGAEFSLERTQPEAKQPKTIWSGLFTRSKTYPATNQLGALGSTSALINASEFERALQELARSLVAEAHNNMLLRF